jgi:FkbM family methyltransferase
MSKDTAALGGNRGLVNWPWWTRAGQEIRLWAARWRGRPHRVDLAVGDRRLTLLVTSRRELQRAARLAYEGAFLERILDHLGPDALFFDIGANIGLVSLLVAGEAGGAGRRVHGFEPESRNVAKLRENVLVNGLADRVRAHSLALGAETGEATLHVRGGVGDGRHSLATSSGATGEETVPVDTLAAFCRREDCWPDAIKIDVEGAEGQVLAGMAGVPLARQPRDIFLEVHAKGGRDLMPDGTPLDDWLQERGYTCGWRHGRGSGEHRHYRVRD